MMVFINCYSFQIQYTLGCYYFTVDDFSAAYSAFSQCNKLLSNTPSLVNPDDLRGYLLACESMRADEVGEDMTKENKLERMKINNAEVMEILNILKCLNVHLSLLCRK